MPLWTHELLIFQVLRTNRDLHMDILVLSQLQIVHVHNLIIMLYPIPLKLLAHLSFDSALSLWKLSQTIQFFDHQQKYQENQNPPQFISGKYNSAKSFLPDHQQDISGDIVHTTKKKNPISLNETTSSSNSVNITSTSSLALLLFFIFFKE